MDRTALRRRTDVSSVTIESLMWNADLQKAGNFREIIGGKRLLQYLRPKVTEQNWGRSREIKWMCRISCWRSLRIAELRATRKSIYVLKAIDGVSDGLLYFRAFARCG